MFQITGISKNILIDNTETGTGCQGGQKLYLLRLTQRRSQGLGAQLRSEQRQLKSKDGSRVWRGSVSA